MLTKYGRKEWLLSALISAVLSLIFLFAGSIMKQPALILVALIVILLWIPFALFFRDPSRKIPTDENAIVSPADGVIKDIEKVDCPFGSGTNYKRIGIFLSVLDVHLNRMPVNSLVKKVKYSEGAFHDARSEKASSENESNMILCVGNCAGLEFPFIVKQISGAIARRIVSEAEPERAFRKGEKFGMIKFGSRTELYIPYEERFVLKVSVGDKVYAGSSVIALVQVSVPKS